MRKTTMLPSFAVASALVGTLALCPMAATAQDAGDLVRDDAAIVATDVEDDAFAAGALSLTEPAGAVVLEESPAGEGSSSREPALEGNADSTLDETSSTQPSGATAGDGGAEASGFGDEELPEEGAEGNGPELPGSEVPGSPDATDDSTDESAGDDVVLDSDKDPESASDVTSTDEPGEEPSEDATDEPAEGSDEDTDVEPGADVEGEPDADVEVESGDDAEDADGAEIEPTVDLEDVLASLGEGAEGLGSGVSQVMDESFSSAADAAAQKAEAAEAA